MKYALTKKGAICFFGKVGDAFTPIDQEQMDVFLAEGLIKEAIV